MPPHRSVPGFRRRWAAVVAVLGGLVGAAAFPQLGIWPAAFVSVAALSVAVDGRRCRSGAWLGLLYGLAFFAPLLHWTGVYVGPVPWLILALGEAAFCAALGAVLPIVQRLPAAPVWIGTAWVLQEALRDRLPFGGFPWGRLAFSQAESPMRWFAALGGAPLVSFGVAVAGGALAVAVRHARPLTWRPLAAGLAILVAIPVVGVLVGLPVSVDELPTDQTLRVALIQGNVPQRGLDMETRARQVLADHIDQTDKLIAEVNAGTVARPDLVVWPENASDVDPFNDPVAYEAIDQTVKAIGAPILVGAILQAPDNKRWNAGILWSPTSGPGAQYLKRHPVPFGEYIPLRSVRVGQLRCQDRQPGHDRGQGQRPFARWAGADRRCHLLRGRLRLAGAILSCSRCSGACGPDEQRHVRDDLGDLPAACYESTSRRRDRSDRLAGGDDGQVRGDQPGRQYRPAIRCAVHRRYDHRLDPATDQPDAGRPVGQLA
ncbi:MAG: apolipoprotein N-acyltransferase [Jatrophihabitantaceae bacterium]